MDISDEWTRIFASISHSPSGMSAYFDGSSRAGTVELRVPKLQGQLFSELPQAAPDGREALTVAFSTKPIYPRHLAALRLRLGQGHGMIDILKSQVSRMCESPARALGFRSFEFF